MPCDRHLPLYPMHRFFEEFLLGEFRFFPHILIFRLYAVELFAIVRTLHQLLAIVPALEKFFTIVFALHQFIAEFRFIDIRDFLRRRDELFKILRFIPLIRRERLLLRLGLLRHGSGMLAHADAMFDPMRHRFLGVVAPLIRGIQSLHHLWRQ